MRRMMSRGARRAKSFSCACLRTGHAPSPLFFGRPWAGPRLSPRHAPFSRGAERRQTRGFCETPDGWRAKPSGGTLCEGVPSLPKKRGASRRSTAAFYRCAGRASENVDQPRLSASSWRQVLLPASGAPPSPGSERLRSPSPAAPHQPTAGFPRLADPVSLDQISGPPSPLLRLYGVPCRRPSKSRTSDYKHIGLGSVNSPNYVVDTTYYEV